MVYERVSLAVIHLSAFAFLIFNFFFFSPWNGSAEDLHNGWIDLNNSCADHASSTRLNHTQLTLEALSSEGKKVENVLCLWPLKCHPLSSSDHCSKLFYYSSGSLTSVSSFPVQAVIQVTKINFFFFFFLKQNTLPVSLQGWQTTVNIPDCVKLHRYNLKIQLREGAR